MESKNKKIEYSSSIKELVKEHYKILGTIQASRFIDANFNEIKLSVPISELLSLYKELMHFISPKSLSLNFIKNGISHLEREVANQKTNAHVAPFIAFKLHTLYGDCNRPTPSWLPMVFRELSSGNTDHQFKFYFNWHSVDERFISPKIYALVCALMNRYLCVHNDDPNKNKPHNKDNRNHEVCLSSETKVKSKTANEDVFFSFIYNSMFKDAKERGIVFTLSLYELKTSISELMGDLDFNFPSETTSVLNHQDLVKVFNFKNPNQGYIFGNLYFIESELENVLNRYSDVSGSVSSLIAARSSDIPFVPA